MKWYGGDDDSSLARTIQIVEDKYSDPDPLMNLATASVIEINDYRGIFADVDNVSKSKTTHIMLNINQGTSNACVAIAYLFSVFFTRTTDGLYDFEDKDDFIQCASKDSISNSTSYGFHQAIVNAAYKTAIAANPNSGQKHCDVELGGTIHELFTNICHDANTTVPDVHHISDIFVMAELDQMLSNFRINHDKNCSLTILYGGHAFVVFKFANEETINVMDTISPAYLRKLANVDAVKTHLVYKILIKVCVHRTKDHWRDLNSANNYAALSSLDCMFWIGDNCMTNDDVLKCIEAFVGEDRRSNLRKNTTCGVENHKDALSEENTMPNGSEEGHGSKLFDSLCTARELGTDQDRERDDVIQLDDSCVDNSGEEYELELDADDDNDVVDNDDGDVDYVEPLSGDEGQDEEEIAGEGDDEEESAEEEEEEEDPIGESSPMNKE